MELSPGTRIRDRRCAELGCVDGLAEREDSGLLLRFDVVTEVACGRRDLLALGREVADDLVLGLAAGRDLGIRVVEVEIINHERG